MKNKKTGIIIFLIILVVFFGGLLFALKPQIQQQKEKSAPPPKDDPITKKIESMSLEEKVGQMFFACARGGTIDTGEVTELAPGGYILFADFFETKNPDAVKAEISGLQEASSTPMLFGTDEEGGTVVRVSKYPAFRSAPFASPQEILAQGGEEAWIGSLQEKSQLLLNLGINVNLAPVCDIAESPDDFIYGRTFGKTPEETARLTEITVRTMAKSGIGSVLKHFPGYGNNVDTHTGVSNDTRPLKTFLERDFLPFQAGIKAGADCILVNHNIIHAIDEGNPATLSADVHRFLRTKLEFDGVIMTDDLSMDAIAKYSGETNPAVRAVKAGNDLLCTGDYVNQIPAVIQAVKDGTLSEKRIDDSVRRVLQWKQNLGLWK